MSRRKLKLTAIVTDAGTQIRCAIDPDVVAEYAADMANGDKFPPIVVFKDGAKHILADGFHRVRAAEHNEATDILADVRKGGRRDALKYALSANIAHGLRRTNADKRRCVELALVEWPRMSDREIARMCGVSRELVGDARPQLSESDSSPTRLGADGKERRLPQHSSPTEDDADERAQPRHNHRAQGTGENEWYTPDEEIELVRKVLGEIELDPASSARAQERVKAKRFFTLEDDALRMTWKGKVFLNPPYSQPAIAQFAARMVEQYEVGNVSEAIVLTHNYTDTAWFHQLAAFAEAICFTRGRIQFLDPDGKKAAPTQGQAFFYFGKRDSAFTKVFNDKGCVFRRC